MNLSITVNIAEGLARKIAIFYGMPALNSIMEDGEDGLPMETEVEWTFEEVDHWLETRMKKDITKQYAEAVRQIVLKEKQELFDASMEEQKNIIDGLISDAIVTGAEEEVENND